MKAQAAVLTLLAAACQAEQWEAGIAGGYGLYRNATIIAPAGTADAGIRNRFAFSAVISDDQYDYLGGEIRYTYQDGDPFLEAGGARANIQGQSHAFHYDLLIHTRPKWERIRPYFAIGIGAKLYVVSGPENPVQPLGDIGLLTARDEFKVLYVAGGGVKIRLHDHVLFRLDLRDYITPFPKRVIRPAPGATGRGFLQQFTPLVGVSYVF
jgi:hypothetical protein